jgi:hypothetical protein
MIYNGKKYFRRRKGKKILEKAEALETLKSINSLMT